MTTIRAMQGDITRLNVDAIVNAANHTLLGGGGVDGAIHYAAGPELREECETLDGCDTGEAKMTRGYKLPAKYVIHTVGPVYRNGKKGEPGALENCYRNSLKLAMEHGLTSIAFPCISTGAFYYPLRDATEIAVKTVREVVAEPGSLREVIFCCFSASDLAVYEDVLKT